MIKLTKQQIEESNALRKGGMPVKEIAEKFNVCTRAIYYHTSEGLRERTIKYHVRYYRSLSRHKKRLKQAREREYQRLYHKNKYKTDENFRRKQIELSSAYKKRKQDDSMPILLSSEHQIGSS